MKRSTKIQIAIHVLVVLLILFVAALPLISVLVAGGIANANGCMLDEGGVHPCVVNGQDMGETLYSMGVAGWFMMITCPGGLVLIAVYGVGVAVFYVVRAAAKRGG